MDDENNIVCNKCGSDFPAYQSMPYPGTHSGDLCFQCYDNLAYEWDVKRGIEQVKRLLPSIEDFMLGFKKYAKGSSLDPQILENNCHAAAHTLVEMLKGDHKIKIERGHWHGIDARKGGKTVAQHSWTSLVLPENCITFFVDPTQWVFNGTAPEICVTDEDDTRYDIGGYKLREAMLGKRELPVRKGKLKKSGLKKEAKEWLAQLADRDWSKWTDGEMITIANMDPRNIPLAKPIFSAIINCGNAGFIPIEGRDLAGV